MPEISLAIIEGDEAGGEFLVTGPTVIGADPEAHLVLRDADVAAQHASIVPLAQGFAVQALSPTSATFVNDVRIDAPQAVKPGDRIRVGATVLEVRSTRSASGQSPVQAPAVGGERQIPAVPVLDFVAGQNTGTEMTVGRDLLVGSDPDVADVVLDHDEAVSRRHAAFAPATGGLTVADLGSTTGTLVNDKRLVGTVALKSGDRVQIGETVIEVRTPRERVISPPRQPRASQERPNTIEAEGLVKTFGEHRAVAGINLFVNPGEIYGFLGPNGAGKSTTVHMLVTLMPPTAGKARIAGYDVVSEGGQVRSTIGVALQEAALDAHLNAWEHMALQTALHGIPQARRRKIAEELLERVELTEAAGRLVGGYSGGMKRRLDLALSLVHTPRVLFLDEPTTGLDPTSRTALWEEVARLVREEGMTVFLTTQYLEEADVMADRVGIIDHGEIVAEDTPAALKAEIGRPTVEVVPVDSGDFAAASSVLAGFGELTGASHGGVAARLRPGADDLADVIRALDAASIRVTNVQLRAPTLDDVFLVKTGRSMEGAADETPGRAHSVVLDQLSAGSGLAGAGSGPGAEQ